MGVEPAEKGVELICSLNSPLCRVTLLLVEARDVFHACPDLPDASHPKFTLQLPPVLLLSLLQAEF